MNVYQPGNDSDLEIPKVHDSCAGVETAAGICGAGAASSADDLSSVFHGASPLTADALDPYFKEVQLNESINDTVRGLGRLPLSFREPSPGSLMGELFVKPAVLKGGMLRLESWQDRVAQFTSRMANLTASHEAWEQAFAADAAAYTSKLCAATWRRGSPACARFLAAAEAAAGVRHDDGTPGAEPGSNITAWGRGLVDLQRQMEARRKDILRARERKAALRRNARLEARRELLQADHQRWDASMASDIATYHEELCADPRRSDSLPCARSYSRGQAAAGRNTWAQGLVDLQRQFEARRRSMLRARERRRAERQLAALDARLGHLQAEQKRKDASMASDIMAFGRELCMEPQRRGYASCARFINSGQEDEIRTPALRESHVNLTAPEALGSTDDASDHHGWTPVTAWARGLVDLQRQMELRMRNTRRSRGQKAAARRLTSLSARRERRAADLQTWDAAMASSIMTYGMELCKDPQRVGDVACTKYLNSSLNASDVTAQQEEVLLLDVAEEALPERKVWTPLTDWARGLLDLQREMEARRKSIKRAREQRAASRHLSLLHTRLRQLQASHQRWDASMASGITAYGQELCADPRRRAYAPCAKLFNSSRKGGTVVTATPTMARAGHSGMTAWARGLVDLQRQMEARKRDLKRARDQRAARRQAALLHARRQQIQAQRRHWDGERVSEITDFGRKLCLEPRRSGYKSCARWRGASASAGTAFPAPAAMPAGNASSATRLLPLSASCPA
jgi:hypothetical protein